MTNHDSKTSQAGEIGKNDAPYLSNPYRYPAVRTCPHCFAMVDLRHAEGHTRWHFPISVTPAKMNGEHHE